MIVWMKPIRSTLWARMRRFQGSVAPLARRLAPLVVGLAGLGGLALGARAADDRSWLINESPSLAKGVYRANPGRPRVGDVVALEPPPEARAYLSSLGFPRRMPLLKRVVAEAGALVCSIDGRVTWTGGEVFAPSHDRRGRRLPSWEGCVRLGPDDLFVVGDTPASFDGRYFGPVRRDRIRGVYERVGP